MVLLRDRGLSPIVLVAYQKHNLVEKLAENVAGVLTDADIAAEDGKAHERAIRSKNERTEVVNEAVL